MKVITILFFFFFGASTYIFAQPGPPPDPDVPISGIEWLLLSGGIFGARKLFKKLRKDQKD